MTSPTGLTGTWTLRDTPVLGDYVIPGTGTDVQTLHYITQTGYNYSTDSTTYNNDAGVPDRVIPALTNGHIWRLDRVFCSLRAQYSGRTAYCRVTIQAASLYGGVETQIAEFTETSTTYQEKSLAVSIESATNETVTLRFWGKTSNSTSKAVISLAGCDVTEFNGAGGSTIGYTRGEWKDIEYSPELNVIVCVSQTGVENNILQGNGIMNSTSAVDWIVSYAPVNNANQSVAYSAYYNMFAIVASSGTGTRLLTSNLFGQVLGPENWNLGEGANRSADAAIDGIYSLQIEGDGVTQIIGLTTQKLSISAGERYILLGYCTISGLTAGSARADIVSGTMVIKELNFTADCDWTQQRISFKLNVAHDDIYLRVYGYNLNDGAIIKFDKLLVERASDFEEGATGSDIATFGTEDVIPDVVIAGVEYNPDGSSAGETITYTTPANVVDASSAVTYEEIFTDTLLARTDGGAYKLDKVFGKLRTAKLNYAAYMKVTVTAASKNGGAEYTIAEWTAGMLSTEYEKKGRDVSIVFAENEAVTIKFYLMSKVAAGRAEAMEMGYTYTEMAYGFATTENLYLWNNADTSKVMKCCNKIYPKYIMEINRDGTGSLSYSENFLNESILYIATSAVFTTYDAIKDCLFIDDAGSIVLPFDCMCPISGVPYINLYVVSGNPQISISYDANGSPEMFWPVDGNQSTAAEQAEMFRLLNNADHVILNNRTKFYLKIEPYGSNTCEISSLFVDIKTSTIDVERFKLYKGGEANTLGAQVDGRCSAVVTLRYHDWDPAV
jgi:hypothetical protein